MPFIQRFLQRVKEIKLQMPLSIFYFIQFTHGLKCNPNDSRIMLIFRFIMVSINAAFCVYILQIAYFRHKHQPVLTRINSSFDASGSFPAVAICNENLISLKESVVIKNILKDHGKSDLEIDSFLDSLQELTHFGPSVADVQDHTDIMNILKSYNYNTDSIMYLLHQKCEDFILFCSFSGITKDCSELFYLIKTEDGHCCVFNSNSVYKGRFGLTSVQKNHYDVNSILHETQTADISHYFTTQAGWGSGLRVLLNIEPSSYPSWSKARSYGAKVIFFEPHEYAEITVTHSSVSMGDSVGLDFEPIVYSSDDNLRIASPEQRECWFPDEAKTLFQADYSFENCVTECMMNDYIRMCGCLPYKYPRLNATTNYCELSDLKCLNNVTARIDPDCECEFECEDEHYVNGISVLPLIPSLFPTEIIENYNTSELAELQVFLAQITCNSYQKFLLADRNNKIIVYGGIFSLFFGFSTMSFIELLYLAAAYILAIVVKIVAWIYDKIIN